MRFSWSVCAVLALPCACNHVPPVALASPEAAAPCRESRIEATVCAGRPGCHLESVVEGGKSLQGADLFVAMVSLPPVKKDVDTCTPRDVWLVSAAGSDMRATQRLAQACTRTVQPSIRNLDPGHARFVVGEDSPSDAGPGQWPPSLWGRDFTLDPPQVTRLFWDKTYWDYSRFEGATCESDVVERCSDPSLTLPSVDAGDRFAAGGWRTTYLGDCSMRFGPVRALLSRGALYIELDDGSAPLQAPVEIVVWPTPEAQLIFKLHGDGKVEKSGSLGAPTVIEAERSILSNARRYRIADEAFVANAAIRIKYGDYASAAGFYKTGKIVKIYPNEAVCAPVDGTLQVTRVRHDVEPSKELR